MKWMHSSQKKHKQPVNILCSISRDMQTKTTLRAHLTHQKRQQMLEEHGEDKPLFTGACTVAQPFWKLAWRYPMKLKQNHHHDPAIPLLVYIQRTPCLITETLAHLCFMQFYSQRGSGTSSKSMNRWMDNENVLHIIYNGILFSWKEKWNYEICRKMNRSENYHIKQGDPDWDKVYCLILRS